MPAPHVPMHGRHMDAVFILRIIRDMVAWTWIHGRHIDDACLSKPSLRSPSIPIHEATHEMIIHKTIVIPNRTLRFS